LGVQFCQGAELLFSRHCVDEAHARYAATAIKQDQLRGGWVDAVTPDDPQ
jgi:hypothetical protein